MPHPAPADKSFADRNGLYQQITDKIVAELEQGRLPGSSPGQCRPPRSAYRKTLPPAALTLASIFSFCGPRSPSAASPTQHWLTFRQALKIGAHVKKGEKGTTVVFADRFIPVARAHARRRDRRRARSDPVSEALHGVQRRPVRGSAGRSGAGADAAGRKPHPAAGRGADPRDRRRHPYRRRPRLLCAERTTISRCRRRRATSSRSTGIARCCMNWFITAAIRPG